MEADFRPKGHMFVIKEGVEFPAGKGHTSSEAIRRFEQRCRKESEIRRSI